VNFYELQSTVKSWYKDYDLKDFNEKEETKRNSLDLKVIQKSGITTNLFYAYKEDDKFYLLDGFNRLLTDYGDLEKDTPVYVKIIEEKLTDSQLMSILFNLNLWKLYNDGYGGFRLYDFIDRGFRLFIKSKFDIDLYFYRRDYSSRHRNDNDIDILDHYFRNEYLECDSFKYDYKYVATLFLNNNLITDFKDLIHSNNYLDIPFRNYEMFLKGYAKFLSSARLKKDDSDYKFDDFLNKLYSDKVFFEKLKKMSGNEATRKNIYKFFLQFHIK
jgi:hypothetical protein